MTNSYRRWCFGLLCAVAGLASFVVMPIVSAGPPAVEAASDRWYTPSQAKLGREVFQENCAVCHGAGGEGAPNWEQRDFLGHYPPPPLNGGGHSAHHPLKQMLNTVTNGGAAMGGTMPAFGDILDEPRIHAVIAYFQSLWPDEIYADWVTQNFATVSH